MIEVFKALALGVVEGLTEFIPVSSTGHLIIFNRLLGFEGHLAQTFDIVIQLGAILAIIYLYPRDFINFKVLKRIGVGILPILIAGFLLEKLIKRYLFSVFTVALGLLTFGAFMIWIDRRKNPESQGNLASFSLSGALLIGLFQCLALWPGVSRSGATIVGGLLAGLTYTAAAQFSFLLAVPVMIIATSYELLQNFSAFSRGDILILAVGFVTSFIFAVLSVKTFMSWLNRLKLTPFGIYRIVLAVVLLFLLGAHLL